MLIIKVPSNCGALSKKDGIELAPDAVLKHINEFYLKEDGTTPQIEIEGLSIDNGNFQETNKIIIKRISKLSGPAILLGGDHALTYAAYQGFAGPCKNPGILVLDAHPDCQNYFSPPSHEDYLRMLIEEDILKKDNVLLIGLRNMDAEELLFLNKHKIKFFDMREIAREGLQEVSDAAIAVAKTFDSLYLSIDIDVLDPAFAPGTGYREPGGLTSRELLYLIERVRYLKNLSIVDIVEVNPKLDRDDLTVKAAAKLIIEMS